MSQESDFAEASQLTTHDRVNHETEGVSSSSFLVLHPPRLRQKIAIHENLALQDCVCNLLLLLKSIILVSLIHRRQ